MREKRETMKVTELGEDRIRDIGHAFGYYDYGEETGLTYVPARAAISPRTVSP